MNVLKNRFCSHCFKQTSHRKINQNYLRRNVYQCIGCKNYTLVCRAISCDHMSKGALSEERKKEIAEQLKKNSVDSNGIKNFISKFASWDDEYCAVHDGTIGSFHNLSIKLQDISEYKKIVARNNINLVRAVKIASTGLVVGGATVFTFGSAVPAAASLLGASGFLGAASTGTLISSLSGAALSSASLAAIGGSVAGGTLIVSACGFALGGVLGGAVTNKYIGEDKSFSIKKLHNSDVNNNMVFVNGFLQENELLFPDWIKQQTLVDRNCTMFGVTWSSSTNLKLGRMFLNPFHGDKFAQAIIAVGAKGGKAAAKRLGGIAGALNLGYTALANEWHTSMYRAGTTGAILADVVSRTHLKYYDFSGHSLGARVIYYMLESLLTKPHLYNDNKIRIGNIFLLGGAVGNDAEIWEKIAKLIDGKIYNCFSKNDGVLKWLYSSANLKLSNPIGYSPIISNSSKIQNIDCTDIVDSHLKWKDNYAVIRQRIMGSY